VPDASPPVRYCDPDAHEPGCTDDDSRAPCADPGATHADVFCNCHHFTEPKILSNCTDISWPAGWTEVQAADWREKHCLVRAPNRELEAGERKVCARAPKQRLRAAPRHQVFYTPTINPIQLLRLGEISLCRRSVPGPLERRESLLHRPRASILNGGGDHDENNPRGAAS
jgi:hypothetical protein